MVTKFDLFLSSLNIFPYLSSLWPYNFSWSPFVVVHILQSLLHLVTYFILTLLTFPFLLTTHDSWEHKSKLKANTVGQDTSTNIIGAQMVWLWLVIWLILYTPTFPIWTLWHWGQGSTYLLKAWYRPHYLLHWTCYRCIPKVCPWCHRWAEISCKGLCPCIKFTTS